MQNSPLISIALCTYNGARFLVEQMDSLLNQSYTNLEIIVVDDCSSDNTAEILRSYAARDSRVTVIVNESNLGYNKNFEKTLRKCTGSLIAICDQDDVWHKEKVRSLFENIKDHQLIYHDSEFIDTEGNSMKRFISDKFNFYRGNRPEPFLYLNCVSGHSILMKQEVVQRALPFPAGFHYDQWLAFVATSIGSIDYVDDALVKYRLHNNNNTDILALKKSVKSKEERIKQLEKESEWLRICAEFDAKGESNIAGRLYTLSLKRNLSLFSLSYGLEIWKHRELLHFLLKKNTISKFFFTLRTIWGAPAKNFFNA
jgi:glycosyltransferase involved in cell wall biosynthesis